jgi:branched-chain amino acid transport system permease protein
MMNGLTLGVVYALIALGYTIIFSILRLINFAHGDFFMVGAFAALVTVISLTKLNLPPVLILFLSMLAGLGVGALMGIISERLAFRRVLRISVIATMITSLGLSIVLQNMALLIFGPAAITFPSVLPTGSIVIFGVAIQYKQIFLIVTTFVIIAILFQWLNRTKAGLALRAVAQEPIAASLSGISSTRVIVIAFAVGSGLAGLAGWLSGMYYGRASFFMGTLPGLKAFTAVIIGGMGSLPGAVLGAIIMGVLEVIAGSYISYDYKDAITLGILILVLIIRPQGLFGQTIFKKV